MSFKMLSGDVETAMRIFSDCEAVRKSAGESIMLAELYIEMSALSGTANKEDDCIERYLFQARDLLPEDDYRVPPLCTHLAISASDRGEYEKALSYSLTAYKAARRAASPCLLGAICREMAQAQFRLGDHEAARNSILESLALMGKNGSRRSLARGHAVYREIMGTPPPVAHSV